MTLKKSSLLFAVFLLLIGLNSCQKDDDNNNDLEGSVRFEITDAPIDDTSVKGVFVTVADIKVDGKSIEGFNKTTIDVLAYQNGETKFLSNTNLEAKSYNEITLVLDYERDENGNSPGCYVEEDNGSTKHPLTSASNEIKINHNFNVSSEKQTQLVLDFDLRKCVKRESSGSDKYDFVTNAELNSSIRVVNKNNTGAIKGNCSDVVSGSDKVVVYAYKKGTFDRSSEVNGQGQSSIEFYNAESSSAVDANGNYELHFLEEGEYEIHYCSYKEDSENKMELTGTLIVDVLGSLQLNAISVDASTDVTVNVLVTGVLPI